MLQETVPNLAKFVEPDRVRREVYTDPSIFEMEMGAHSTSGLWIYCGHETQVPKRATLTRADRPPADAHGSRQGRHDQRPVHRCPHRGSMMCGDRSATRQFFRCSYHSWTFTTMGR